MAKMAKFIKPYIKIKKTVVGFINLAILAI